KAATEAKSMNGVTTRTASSDKRPVNADTTTNGQASRYQRRESLAFTGALDAEASRALRPIMAYCTAHAATKAARAIAAMSATFAETPANIMMASGIAKASGRTNSGAR